METISFMHDSKQESTNKTKFKHQENKNIDFIFSLHDTLRFLE